MSRIALADDHAVVREGLRRLFETAGHDVVAEIGDGLAVEDRVKETHPDVLILDLDLPGLHGLDVMRRIGRDTSTRVLVLSAERRDDFVIAALKQGAKGYVLKSCSGQELLKAVSTVSSGGHYVATELSDALVRTLGDGGSQMDPYDALSDREREVFHAMAEGLSNAAIGERLFISHRTVETHRANILRALGLKGQTDIVLYALRRGVIKL